MALDARIVVKHLASSFDHYVHTADSSLPQPPGFGLATGRRHQYKNPANTPGRCLIEQSFVRELSAQSKYFRFMQGLNELTQQMLVRFTQLDYHRELAMIAVLEDPSHETELGVARYVMNPDGKSCEFALVVADKWQNRGIGSRLMTTLIDAARQRGFTSMDGEIMTSNHHMLALVEHLGFSIRTSSDDSGIKLASRVL